MADLDAVHRALRAHAMTATVRSTGLVSLAATATGFTRSVGSFVADGFERGMEIVPTNFADNFFSAVVTSVAPNDLRVEPFVLSIVNNVQVVTRPPITPSVEADARMLTATIPSMHAWENESPLGATTFDPVNGIPYLEEEFSPSIARKVGAPIKQSITEEMGDYFLKWHGVPNVGASALRKGIDALKNVFASGTVIPAGIDSVYIDSDPAPTTGGIIQTTSRPVLILRIPWIVRSRPNLS